MIQNNTGNPPERKDFFISYTSSDQPWAEWIAVQLEADGYTLFLEAWDVRPGANLILAMNKAATQAERTLLILSPASLKAGFTQAQWATAFHDDPTGAHTRLLPVRVEACLVDGLLRQIVSIDLVDLDEAQARDRLRAGVQQGRMRPERVAYPGQHIPQVVFPGSLPAICNIPFARNPFFTGREGLLEQLHTQLQTTLTAAVSQPQAISGLGGIGKTQLAIEYAYRYRQEYQAVLWARADTTEALNASYTEIARWLTLPQQDAQEQEVIVQAVKEWLRRKGNWLLILDNADDLDVVRAFVPTECPGHLLLTTRAQIVGKVAQRFEVDTLEVEVGALLLLRRAGLVDADGSLDAASPSDRAIARTLSEDLGGLPLALDQAGAYIEETQCSLTDYERQYQTRRAQLLAHRGKLIDDHPEPVATTWSLSFQKVEQQNPAAAELLRFCAFLAPDAIPEELLSKKANGLEGALAHVAADSYQLDLAVAALRAYSLITRDPVTNSLSIHRLVQAIVSNMQTDGEQQQWKRQVVLVLNATFPDADFANWTLCERLLPHTLRCADWIRQEHMFFAEAMRLLNCAGIYLRARARFAEAEDLFTLLLTICEQQWETQPQLTATGLNNLAALYRVQGKYEQAEPLYVRSLEIYEQRLGPEHPDTIQSFNNLGLLYHAQGKYEQAEPLYVQALAARKQQLGTEHLDVAQSLNNLGLLCCAQGKYEQAEPLLTQALTIREQQLEAEHPDIAQGLNNLAELYRMQRKYEQAELLYKRALSLREKCALPGKLARIAMIRCRFLSVSGRASQ